MMINRDAMVCEIYFLLFRLDIAFLFGFGFGAWIELLVFLAFLFGFSFG